MKSVAFRIKMSGEGVVNFDSNEKKYVLRDKFPNERSYLQHDNTKFAKINLYKTGEKRTDKDGKPVDVFERKLVISADCLRHHIFLNEMPFQNPAVMQHEALLYRVMGSSYAMLRGYMFANSEFTYKRASPVCVTSAEQTNGGILHFQVGSNSGPKKSDQERGVDDTTGNTSLRYEETIGHTEYECKAMLDLKELAFVSLDQSCDRQSCHPDKADLFRAALSESMKSEIGAPQRYVSAFAQQKIPEYGILLSQEQVVKLAKEFVQKLMAMRIVHAKAYAEVVSVEFKVVEDTLSDLVGSDEGWKKINTIDDFSIDPNMVCVGYIPFNDTDWTAYQQEGTEALSRENASKEQKRTEKAEKKKKGKKPAADLVDSEEVLD